MTKLLFLLSLPLLGQNLYLNAGGGITGFYEQDRNFSSSFVAIDPTLGFGPLQTQRYGTSFSYSLPAPNGLYWVYLDFVEPNKTAIGQRIFSVTLGESKTNLDIFFLAGGQKKPYRFSQKIKVTDGRIDILLQSVSCNAQPCNAFINAISIERSRIHTVMENVPISGIKNSQFQYILKEKPVIGTTLFSITDLQGNQITPPAVVQVSELNGLINVVIQETIEMRILKLWYLSEE